MTAIAGKIYEGTALPSSIGLQMHYFGLSSRACGYRPAVPNVDKFGFVSQTLLDSRSSTKFAEMLTSHLHPRLVEFFIDKEAITIDHDREKAPHTLRFNTNYRGTRFHVSHERRYVERNRNVAQKTKITYNGDFSEPKVWLRTGKIQESQTGLGLVAQFVSAQTLVDGSVKLDMRFLLTGESQWRNSAGELFLQEIRGVGEEQLNWSARFLAEPGVFQAMPELERQFDIWDATQSLYWPPGV